MSAVQYSPAQSPINDALLEISASLNLDPTTRDNAAVILHKFVAADPESALSRIQTVASCAVLIASKATTIRTVGGDFVRGSQVSLSKLLYGVDLTSFILQLKEFLRVVHIEEAAAKEVKQLITVFAFCMTFHAKFEEIWTKLAFTDRSERPEMLSSLKQVAWLVFIIARVNLCQKRTEVVECACMLIGAFEFTVAHLPSSVSCSLDHGSSSLAQLCGLLKVNEQQAQIVVTHIEMMMSQLKAHNMLRGNVEGNSLDGVFSACHLSFNISNMSTVYQQSLSPEEIDERDFLSMKGRVRTPTKAKVITPFAKQGKPLDARNLRSRRTLNFEMSSENHDISLSSKLNEVKLSTSKSPFTEATPMSLALEINRWFIELTDDVSIEIPSENLRRYLELAGGETCQMVQSLLVQMKQQLTTVFEECNIKTVANDVSFIELHFITPAAPPKASSENEKLISVLRLYLVSLEGMLDHEESKQDSVNYAAILNNSAFHSALYACCLETVFFVHNITALTFEEILQVCQISAFEFWKLINTFAQFDPRMPLRLKRHFRELEVKILSCLGWEQKAPIHQYLRKVVEGEEVAEQNVKSYDMFFRRVLSQAAHRIVELSDSLSLSDSVREEIWAGLKHALSEQTELMIDRHLDQLILCTIYAICKMNRLRQASFKFINERYSELYNEDNARVLRFVRLDGDSTGDIIKFYNQVYIHAMKHHLTQEAAVAKPRIAALNPPSPLRANLPPPMTYRSLNSPMTSPGPARSPMRSPYMTPRTQGLYCFGESPSRNLESINRMISKQCIDFDLEPASKGEPKKRPRHLAEILEQTEESFMLRPAKRTE